MHALLGVLRGSTTEPQGMERASWGGGFSDWNRMLYNSSPFSRRPDTHTHTHGRYTDLLEQFCSRFKVIEGASVNSVVEDVRYHDSFTLASPKKSPPPPGSWVPKASAANVDKQGTKWTNLTLLSGFRSMARRALRLDGPALLQVWASA